MVPRWVVAACLLCAALPLGAFQQDGSPASQPLSHADEFIGTWKFNVHKSSSSGTEREVITIETQGNDYKFIYDWLAKNGTELNWWFVTDMKGTCVKDTQVNGRPMSSQSCMTRVDSRTFLNETPILKDDYKVSRDGQELDLHRVFLFPHNLHGKVPREVDLVFDRVSTVQP
jgi:hypothetical protein